MAVLIANIYLEYHPYKKLGYSQRFASYFSQLRYLNLEILQSQKQLIGKVQAL